MSLAADAANNRTQDLQLEGFRLSMTPDQLRNAALRLRMRTRIAETDPRTGRSDFGTDAALVADAYLDLLEERTTAKAREIQVMADGTINQLKMHPSIQLASGVYFDFLEPDTTPLTIEDVAAGLSRICRFTGQLGAHIDPNAVYTVAQHSVLASENCEPGYELEALLHDASESVLGDVSSPLKQLMPCYRAIEHGVEASIARTFNLPTKMSAPVKAIDLVMLATEKRDLMPRRPEDTEVWALLRDVDPLPFTIRPWSPSEARNRFLHRYVFLTTGLFPSQMSPFAYPHEGSPAAYREGYRAAAPAYFASPAACVQVTSKIA
ncbi:hypothetical protein KIKIMORA_04310 [Brevundimonas phage vB_BpoS-Kikimora]|uniref:Uncharacterized protein n=1 Tax=Brevundimonas phage vB_BpoS-Kikimora TaxID=2948601 RepID=A0A9E7SLH4_9CAUD|nr:hypothetical protein KIKIMORA_04310 [Brevundimonas phage vB_BpoS-Kikimora]